MASKDGKLVWSSRGLPPATPARPPAAPGASGASGATGGTSGTAGTGGPPGRVRVRLERQGRGGKVVSVVENLPGHPERIEELARLLKARCGAGGTVRGRVVEIQGDHRDRIVAALAGLGLAAVRAGG